MRELTYNEAAVEAVAEEMRRDPKIFYMSTDALPPLLKEFGSERVRATPITEAALTGMAIGAAGCGFRPIVDWRQVTFCFVAMDQIVNQAAKIHYMFGGQVNFPILYRAAVGGGGLVAAQHSQSPYSMFMNVAGLKMFLPSTPYDIKGLLKTAIRDNNPVISFESNVDLARPKSVSFGFPRPSNSTFAGFKSRWTMPRSWAYAMAAHSSRTSRVASVGGSGPSRRTSARLRPSTYAIVK